MKSPIDSKSPCPCGTGLTYAQCCEPFHQGTKHADTAEKLMRSRYSAYVTQKIDYIKSTSDPAHRDSFDEEAALLWARESEWLGLEMVATRGGQSTDLDGEVEFKARYRRDGKETTHHEVSLFKRSKSEPRWYYSDGKEILEPLRNDSKTGRNDLCPCGSGRKFKKCCG